MLFLILIAAAFASSELKDGTEVNLEEKKHDFHECVKPNDIKDGTYYIKVLKTNTSPDFHFGEAKKGPFLFFKQSENLKGLLINGQNSEMPSEEVLFSVHKNDDKTLEISSEDKKFGLALSKGYSGNGFYMYPKDMYPKDEKKPVNDKFVYNENHELFRDNRLVRASEKPYMLSAGTQIYRENKKPSHVNDAVYFCFQEKETETKIDTGGEESNKPKTDTGGEESNKPKTDTGGEESNKPKTGEKTDGHKEKKVENPKNSSIKSSIFASFVAFAFIL